MTADELAALGAVLSGVGAVCSSALVLHRVRRRAERDCDKRIDELHRELERGVRIGRGDHETTNPDPD